MSVGLTEQQQIDQLKQWWKKNGTSTLVIFILIFAAGIAWHFWQVHREQKLERASMHYEQLLNAVVNNDDQIALKEANLLRDNYTHTPYAALATLLLAKSEVYQLNYPAAETQLNWVIKHGNTDSLRELARLRLARVLLEEKKPQQALDILKKTNDAAYFPVIQEIKGDSYAALNENDKARSAYKMAISNMPTYAMMHPIIVMKLNNLATGNS